MANNIKNLPHNTDNNKPKLGTKMYLLLLFAAVFAIVPILLAFHLSSNNNVAVPEEGIYVVGEKMTYHRTVTYDANNKTNTIESTSAVEVLGFDGENYNLKQTTWMEGQELTINLKTNLSGETTEIQGYAVDPDDSSSLFPVYGDTVRFNTENVTVGDSWTVPLESDQDGITVRATISYTFSETTTVTVPAGTYNVMKIEAQISDFESSGIVGGQQTEVTKTVTGYILLEESTHKIIEYETVDFSSMVSGSETSNGTTTTFEQLVEHNK